MSFIIEYISCEYRSSSGFALSHFCVIMSSSMHVENGIKLDREGAWSLRIHREELVFDLLALLVHGLEQQYVKGLQWIDDKEGRFRCRVWSLDGNDLKKRISFYQRYDHGYRCMLWFNVLTDS